MPYVRSLAHAFIRGQPDSIIVNEIITFRLKKIVGHDVSADVVDGYAIHAAVLPFVPVPNLGEGLTDRMLASASGGIKKFNENDLPRKIAEPHRRGRWTVDAAGRHRLAGICPIRLGA